MADDHGVPPSGCLGCLGFLIIILGDLAVMILAAVNDKPWVFLAAGVLWVLILPVARWYRGVT